LARIPRPRIGYTGYIKKQLDWQLLRHLTAQHPKWHFVFVGPKSPHPEISTILEEVAGRPNVHFLGAKTTQELAAYPQHFDVCIMPYRVNDYTKYIYPLKLHEYLASGRPVVATPIRSLEEYCNVLTLAAAPNNGRSGSRKPCSPRQVRLSAEPPARPWRGSTTGIGALPKLPR